MRRTQNKGSNAQKSKRSPDHQPPTSPPPEPVCSPNRVESAFALLEGRWKLAFLYHLFQHAQLRFSDLERLLPKISQRMLSQQLRSLERNEIVERTVYPQVPPRVDYRLTPFGYELRPILHCLLVWAARRPSLQNDDSVASNSLRLSENATPLLSSPLHTTAPPTPKPRIPHS